MPALTKETLDAQLAAGELQPVYLVVGDDEGDKDDIARAFQAAVPDDIQAFAFERYSALDTDPGVIVNSARTLPFLGDRRVIVVTRAEKWFSGKRKAGEDAAEEDDAGSGGGDALEAYFEKVYYWTTPVADCGDDRGDVCKDYSEWTTAWTEIRG